MTISSRCVGVVVFVSLCIPAPAPAQGPAPAGGEAALAAESLCHSATHLKFLPDAPARPFRLRALILMAAQLAPENAEVNDLLALLYSNHPDGPSLLIGPLEKSLAARPGNFLKELEWLAARLEALHNAKERLAFLSNLIDDTARSTQLRAEAALRAGVILEAEANAQQARAMFARSLAIDPCNPAALLRADWPAGDDRAGTLVRLLRLIECDPPQQPDLNVPEPAFVVRVAMLLDAAGLHEESIPFFDCWWRWSVGTGKADRAIAATIPYFNALLNAGKHGLAIELFGPHEKEFADNADFLSLLVDAYDAAGDAAAKTRPLELLAKRYPVRGDMAAMSTGAAAEQAMFHLLLKPNPQAALAEANEALRTAGKDPQDRQRAQRVVGAAELVSGKPQLVAAGEEKLKGLLGRDLFAAVFLAEHYYAVGNAAAGRETILASAPTLRSGPAFRRLTALAARHGVQIPPDPDAQVLRAAKREFKSGILQFRAEPQKFLQVTLKPAGDTVSLGEPLRVEATLTNIGTVPLTVGPGGLMGPTMALGVKLLTDADKLPPGADRPFVNLPLLAWPCPRRVPPGASFTQSVRFDVGPLAQLLARYPLADLTVSVQGLLSPDANLSSSVPLPIRAVPIRRPGFVPAVDSPNPDALPAAYQQALGRVVTDISGTPAVRMRAARQVAALLALAKNAQSGSVKLPLPLDGKLNKPVLLRVMINLLKDPSAAVRAEMLAALQGVPLDESVVRYLGPPLIEDSSPLVRLRLVELMGAAGKTGPGSVVEVLAEDPDKYVKMMAQGFLQIRDKK